MLSPLRRAGLVAIALFALTAAVGVVEASACNSGWSRTPDDGDRYYAGITASPSYLMNGVNANIYTTLPTTPSSIYGTAQAFSSTWVGLDALDTSNRLILIQEGYVKTYGNGGVDCTVYQINNGSAIWNHQCGQTLTNGNTYNWNIYYRSSDGTMHFDFAGVEKWNVVMSSVGEPLNNSAQMSGEVQAEIGSYNQQMVGTSDNAESYTQLEVRSGTTWHTGSDQGWAFSRQGITTPGHPAHVSQTRINASFNGAFANGSNPVAAVYDNCTSS